MSHAIDRTTGDTMCPEAEGVAQPTTVNPTRLYTNGVAQRTMSVPTGPYAEGVIFQSPGSAKRPLAAQRHPGLPRREPTMAEHKRNRHRGGPPRPHPSAACLEHATHTFRRCTCLRDARVVAMHMGLRSKPRRMAVSASWRCLGTPRARPPGSWERQPRVRGCAAMSGLWSTTARGKEGRSDR
jgi:hypothetical protein